MAKPKVSSDWLAAALAAICHYWIWTNESLRSLELADLRSYSYHRLERTG